MLLKSIGKALEKEDVGIAMKLAGHLLEVGGGPAAFSDRKVHVLLRAMEGTSPSVRTEFIAKVLDRFGDDLGTQARERLAGRLDRI